MIDRETLRQLGHILRPIVTRVQNLAARAIVTLVKDTEALQELQMTVLAGEEVDDAERFQEYGFTSVPIEGAEAVIVFPNGDRSHPLVVAVDDRRYRPVGLERGEVAIYHKDGAIIKLNKDGDIELTPKSGRNIILAGSDRPVLVPDGVGALITCTGGTVTHNLSAAGKIKGG